MLSLHVQAAGGLAPDAAHLSCQRSLTKGAVCSPLTGSSAPLTHLLRCVFCPRTCPLGAPQVSLSLRAVAAVDRGETFEAKAGGRNGGGRGAGGRGGGRVGGRGGGDRTRRM